MRLLLLATALFASAGCTSPDHDMLMRQLKELKQARDRGVISEAEYFRLKIQAEQAYGQRRASRKQRLESY